MLFDLLTLAHAFDLRANLIAKANRVGGQHEIFNTRLQVPQNPLFHQVFELGMQGTESQRRHRGRLATWAAIMRVN